VSGLLFSQLGCLFLEANDLDAAQQYLNRGLALGEQLGLGGDLIFALARSAQVRYVLGERQGAFDALHRAHELAIQTGFVDDSWPRALEANLRLQEGDVSFAHHWAVAAGFAPHTDAHYLRIEQHLVYARLLLAQGRLSDARRSLARLEQLARDQGLHRWLITVHILQALTADRTGDRATACELLSRALNIGASGGYYRSFLDEGVRAIELAKDLRHVAPQFVDRLIADANIPETRRDQAAQPLVEPLSERELQVLRLIAAGLANREIAGELVIALGTVKRHINHIYGKLCVHSRTQAIAQARTLQILDG
jgi:LuxR family maltose regulon positive regulatory protein